MMKWSELHLLSKYLRQARTFFEFGTGASTLYIAQENSHLQRMVSVDLKRSWTKRVRDSLRNRSGIARANIKLLYVDIGRTSGFGFPDYNASHCKFLSRVCREFDVRCAFSAVCHKFPVGRRSAWPSFSNAVLDATTRFQHGWDVVLVDSRFRTACALKSLLATNAQDITRSVVAVHDYGNRTRHYGEIERFADMERAVGKMAVFRKKRDVDPVALQRAIERFEYDPV
eukprot:Skav209445  [mRNA]  locus=scaffold2199:113504:114187:- [translate_table: standard]